MKRVLIRGVGAYLPEKILTNAELQTRLDTTEEWISERTGIRQRHIAAEGELTSDLGAKAARQALADAKLTAADIDLVVLGTTTPDETMPSAATRIQHKIGMTRGAAFDVNAACSGFVYALTVADSLLKTGQGRRALVIGAETYSRILDWEDRSTCILFGDGAGAVVLEVAESDEQRGILYTKLYSDGQFGDLLATTGGVSKNQKAGTLFMSGKEIFRHAVAKMSDGIAEAMHAIGEPVSAIDLVVPHQANWRILAGVAQKLGLPQEKVVSAVAEHANTSAASIPLALAAGQRQGRLKPGQLVVFTALGAGLTWGTCVIRW